MDGDVGIWKYAPQIIFSHSLMHQQINPPVLSGMDKEVHGYHGPATP